MESHTSVLFRCEIKHLINNQWGQNYVKEILNYDHVLYNKKYSKIKINEILKFQIFSFNLKNHNL